MDVYCQHCQKPNGADSQFCRHCASPLPPGAQARYAPPPQGGGQWAQGGGGGQANFQYGPPSSAGAGASGRAIASLILTICGLVLCCGPFTSVPGAVLGWLEVSAIREGRASQRGLVMAQIGLWGGMVITIIGGLLMGLQILVMMAGGFQ